MDAVVEQAKLDSDRAVANIATAIGIAFDKDALAAWQSSRGITASPRAPMDRQTIGLVMAQFPGAIRVRPN